MLSSVIVYESSITWFLPSTTNNILFTLLYCIGDGRNMLFKVALSFQINKLLKINILTNKYIFIMINASN